MKPAAEAFVAGSEGTDDALEMAAGESSDLPLSAVSMAELDSDEEEQVAEVLAAAEVLSGSFIEAEPEELASPEELEPAGETLGAVQASESLSEPAAPTLDESGLESSPLAVSTVARYSEDAAGSIGSEAFAASAPAETSATTDEPADFTGADSGSPTPTLGENGSGAAL